MNQNIQAKVTEAKYLSAKLEPSFMAAQVLEMVNIQHGILKKKCKVDIGVEEKTPDNNLTEEYNYLIKHTAENCQRTFVMAWKNNARDQEKKNKQTAAKRDADEAMVDVTSVDIKNTIKAEVARLLKTSRLPNKSQKGDSLLLDDIQALLTHLYSSKEQTSSSETRTKDQLSQTRHKKDSCERKRKWKREYERVTESEVAMLLKVVNKIKGFKINNVSTYADVY